MSASLADRSPSRRIASRGAWTTVAVVTMINVYAFLDRSILSLLVEPIKADLKLSDTQIGLLLGTALVLFYTAANIPAGYLVDRLNRRRIVGLSCLIWSSVTALSGLAHSFAQLFIGRAGVGLAESTISPAAFSLIRDLIPKEGRGRAFSILASGPFIGSALSLIIGGFILGFAHRGAFADIPLLGGLAGWQVVLLLVGLAGLPLSLLSLAIHEPRAAKASAGASASFRDAFDHMWRARYIYGLLIAYSTACAMLAFGKSAWIPAMLGRNFRMSPAEIGPVLGLINLTAAPAGVLIGGFIIDRLTAAGRDIRSYGLFAAICASVAMVFLPLMPDIRSAWVMYALQASFAGVFYAVGAATLAEITPEQYMGRVTASYLLVQNVIGQALGPLIVAVVADAWTGRYGRFALGYSLSAIGAIVGAISVLSVILLMRALRKSR